MNAPVRVSQQICWLAMEISMNVALVPRETSRTRAEADRLTQCRAKLPISYAFPCRTNRMRSLAFAGAALLMFSINAVAADAPNLVGSWTRSTHTMSLLKGNSKLFTNAEDQAWKLKIDAQDSGAFSGVLSGPVGKPQPIAGAFQPDGRHFVFSTENESGSGEASNDELQYCWTSSRPIIAGCATFKRDR